MSEDIKDFNFVKIAEYVGTSTTRVQRWFQKRKYIMKKAEEKSHSSDTDNSENDSEENEVDSEEVEEIENHFEQRDLNQSKVGTYRRGMKYNTLSEDQRDKLKKFFEDSDRFSDNPDEICEEVGISADRARKWFCNHRYYTKFKLSFHNTEITFVRKFNFRSQNGSIPFLVNLVNSIFKRF